MATTRRRLDVFSFFFSFYSLDKMLLRFCSALPCCIYSRGSPPLSRSLLFLYCCLCGLRFFYIPGPILYAYVRTYGWMGGWMDGRMDGCSTWCTHCVLVFTLLFCCCCYCCCCKVSCRLPLIDAVQNANSIRFITNESAQRLEMI